MEWFFGLLVKDDSVSLKECLRTKSVGELHDGVNKMVIHILQSSPMQSIFLLGPNPIGCEFRQIFESRGRWPFLSTGHCRADP